MATSTPVNRPSESVHIPKLQLDIRRQNGNTASNLTHGQDTADPTADGLFFWKDPTLNFYVRDMTPELLAKNPVIVMERYLPRKKGNFVRKGWVIPGNSTYDGDQYQGGKSNANGYGVGVAEIDNFLPITTPFVGYNTELYNGYVLPLSRFCVDNGNGTFLTEFTRAIRIEEWNDRVRFSQHKSKRNSSMKFRFTLAIPNPNWTSTNHQNRWILGEGITLKVKPRLQTFDVGGGLLEYYIGWNYQVKE